MANVREALIEAVMAADDATARRLATLWHELKAEADSEWDLTSTERVQGSDIDASYHLGKAHALCRVLGDQTGMWDWLERAGG